MCSLHSGEYDRNAYSDKDALVLTLTLYITQFSGENLLLCMVLHAENRKRLGSFGEAVGIQALYTHALVSCANIPGKKRVSVKTNASSPSDSFLLV